MTCRNYIPGPNGDCQRCGEMRAGHAGKLECPQGHEAAQARIEECVREIEIICDTFGYDPNEWLVTSE